MKTLILNDTYNWYHWGCNATSKVISNELKKRGCDVTYIPINVTYSFSPPPKSISDFDDQIFFNNAVRNNMNLFDEIFNNELIIINGEGTLHRLSRQVISLLYIAYVSKKFLRKNVQIINHSSYPISDNKNSKLVETLYKGVYKTMDFVAIREHLSQQVLNNIGIKSTLSFDCLPYAALQFEKKSIESNLSNRKYILVSGGVNLPREKIKELDKTLVELNKDGYEIFFLTGAPNFPANDEKKLIDEIFKSSLRAKIEIVECQTLFAWFDFIKHAKLLVSGRFHHTIASICFNTPQIIFESNTPKNQALAQTFDLFKPILYNDSNFNQNVNYRIKIELSRPFRPNYKIESVYERIDKNFSAIGI